MRNRQCEAFFRVWQEKLAPDPEPWAIRFIPSGVIADTIIWRSPMLNRRLGVAGASLHPWPEAQQVIRPSHIERVEYFHSLALKTRKPYVFDYDIKIGGEYVPMRCALNVAWCAACKPGCGLLIGQVFDADARP